MLINGRKCIFILMTLVLFIPLALPLMAESEGEALFKDDKGEAAIAPLEREIAAGDATADKYNFLGLAYYQAGDYKRSIAAFERGMKVEGAAKWALSYNAGNSAFADGNYASAEGYYSDAYRINGEFHAALLNRANARLNEDKLVEARDDYALYLEKCPTSPQAERIQALLALLDEEIKAHAIIPEKLELSVAVIPAAAVLVSPDEAVDGLYAEPPAPLPAASEAMEREAALLHNAAPATASAEAVTEGDAAAPPALTPPPIESEAMEREAALLRRNATPAAPRAEVMDEGDAIAPPAKVKAKKTLETEEREESEAVDDVTAPPPARRKRDGEETIKDGITAPPPVKNKKAAPAAETAEPLSIDTEADPILHLQ